MASDFSADERRLIEILVESYHRSSDRRFTLKEITKKINAHRKRKLVGRTVKKKLDTLDDYLTNLGIAIKKERPQSVKEQTYCIVPSTLKAHGYQELLHTPKKDTVLLMFGELGMGTTDQDPRSLQGLRYFLEYNTLDTLLPRESKRGNKSLLNSIDAAILSGGALPVVPQYWSKSKASQFRKLSKMPEAVASSSEAGDIKQRQYDELCDLIAFVEGKDSRGITKEYYTKYLENKIITKADAALVANYHLKQLFGDSKIPIHIQWGDEDHENLNELHESNIHKGTKYLKDRHKKLKNQWKEKLEKAKEDLHRLEQEREELAQKQKEHLSSTVEKRLAVLERKLKKAERTCEFAETELMSLEEKVNSDQLDSDRGFVSVFTKRRSLNSVADQALIHLALRQYKGYYALMGENLNLQSYPECKKDLKVNGWHIRLHHNPNVAASNTAIATALEKLVEKANREKRLGDLSPHLTIAAHGANGFEYFVQPVDKETTVKGEYRDRPEQQIMMHLPTLLAQRNLEKNYRNNLHKDIGNKRYDKGEFASGAMIMYLSKNGDHRIMLLENEELIALSYVGEKLRAIDRELEKKTLSKQHCAQLKQQREEFIQRFKFGSLSKKSADKETILLGCDTDQHIGCANTLGRPSNFDVYDAVIDYRQETRLPDHLILAGDSLDGNLDHPYNKAQSGTYIHNKRLRAAMKRLRKDRLSASESVDLAEAIMMMEHWSRGIMNVQDQAAEFLDITREYFKNMFAEEGRLYLLSGNHVGKSARRNLDEAKLLALGLRDYESRTTEFTSDGSDVGLGEFKLPDGRKIALFHRLPGTAKSARSAKKHSLRSNSDAHVIFAGDTHHPRAGYANGQWIIVAPAMQPYTKFVSHIGTQASPRGCTSFYMSANTRSFERSGVLQFVLDETLEQQPTMAEKIKRYKRAMHYLYPEAYKK